MRVLVTRPRADAEPFATRLHALGHTTIVEPLIDIVLLDGPALDLTGVQALAFTSANGARAAAHRTRERNVPVVAVGPATAAEAKTLGFANVSESSGEGVEGLNRHIQATLDPAAGPILHVTGTVTAGDLKSTLTAAGFTARTGRLYEARAAESLSGALTAELSANLVDAATFFSPRTATLFATLIEAENLASACRSMTAVALSQAVANALHPLAFREIRAASLPTTEAMLAHLVP
ncbi:MAG: uroporphyrinogen-III synthase [Micropepsaceae bacterium]